MRSSGLLVTCAQIALTASAFGGEEPAGLTVLMPPEGVRLVHGGGGLPVDFVTRGAAIDQLRVCLGIYYNENSAAGGDFTIRPATDAIWCDEANAWVNETLLASGSHVDTLDLTGIAEGKHVLWAVLEEKRTNAIVGEPEVVRFTVVPRIFVPRYEWQEIVDGQSVPAGLEIVLDMSGKGKRGRIPPQWQLQIWIAGARRFLRLAVKPSTLIRDITTEAAQLANVAPECASLVRRVSKSATGTAKAPAATGVVMDGAMSASEARLFEAHSDRTLDLRLDPTCRVLREKEVGSEAEEAPQGHSEERASRLALAPPAGGNHGDR